MDKVGALLFAVAALLFAVAIIASLLVASTPCGAFLGAGISLNKQFGDSICFDFGKNINVGNSAFGLAGMNVDVNWGVNYDLAALAGYPYGYGGLGSVTQGDLGYFIDVNVDAQNGVGFNGAPWGVPLAEQGIQSTHFGQRIAEQALINDVQVLMPFSGMPVM